jgi:hypothetical protein
MRRMILGISGFSYIPGNPRNIYMRKGTVFGVTIECQQRPIIKYMHALMKNEQETFSVEELHRMHEIRERSQGCYDAGIDHFEPLGNVTNSYTPERIGRALSASHRSCRHWYVNWEYRFMGILRLVFTQ